MPIKSRGHTRESLRQFVELRLNEGVNPVGNIWKKKPLNAVYRALARKKFFGYGSWKEYLENELRVIPYKRSGKFVIPVHPTPDSLRRFVQLRISEKVTLNSDIWAHTQGLDAIWCAIKKRDFLGHGSWRAFLKNEFGITR